MQQSYTNRRFLGLGRFLLDAVAGMALVALMDRQAALLAPTHGGAPAGSTQRQGGHFSRGMRRTGQAWKRAYRKAA